MPVIRTNIKDEPENEEYILGFSKGLNKIQDESLVSDNELTEAKNVMYVVDGVVVRPGTELFGGTQDSKICGGIGFYKSDGTRQFLRISGGKMYYKNGNSWTEITGATYTSGLETNLIQARDRVYSFNGTDNLTRYDGTSITTFTSISTPTGLALSLFGPTVAVTSITRSGSTATVTTTASHGYNTNDYVTIAGAGQTEYNIRAQITVTSTTTFTYTVSGTPATPATGNITAMKDVAGTTPYSYRVSAFNSVGETLACAAVSTAIGPATLDATNYIKLTWNTVSGATGYNIYGRKATGPGETYMATVYVLSYEDKGSDGPSTVLQVPEGNSTTGIKGKCTAFAMSRMFVGGVPNEGSRLYYGGVLNEIDNFSSGSGGFVDVYKNDGGDIKMLIPFQGGLIVGKDNGIYRFSFTSTGYPQLEEITRSFGAIAARGSRAVENDIVFLAKKDGRAAFYALGNQENYTANILRTNEISIKVSPMLENVNLAYLGDAATFYFKNIFGCALPTSSSTINNRVWTLDARFNSWAYWEGISPNIFMTYVDTDGTEYLYYGDESSGYFRKMFIDTRSDNGVAISVRIATKAFNQKRFDTYKIYRNPILWFKDVVGGTVEGQLYIDGIFLSGEFSISPPLGGVGMGVDFAGILLPGSSNGGQLPTAGTSDKPMEITTTTQGRSLKFYITSDELNSNFKFLGVKINSISLMGKRLPSENRVSAT